MMNTVYFIQVMPNGPIKIGFTADNVAVRIRALQQASPYELRWIGFFKGTTVDERSAHKRLARSKLRREWFHPTPEVLEFIKEKSPSFNLEAAIDDLFFGKERRAILEVLIPHDRYKTTKAEMIGKFAKMSQPDLHRWLARTKVPTYKQAQRAARIAVRLGATCQ